MEVSLGNKELEKNKLESIVQSLPNLGRDYTTSVVLNDPTHLVS